jgi:hypothetical protein
MVQGCLTAVATSACVRATARGLCIHTRSLLVRATSGPARASSTAVGRCFLLARAPSPCLVQLVLAHQHC